MSSIKNNVLFKECSSEELIDIVDAFESENFPSEAVVIKQGDSGDHFYVVENGSLDIFVRVVDNDGAEDVRVGSPYVQGGSFGELALMYNTPPPSRSGRGKIASCGRLTESGSTT